jgi:hypothetical protein
VATLVPFVLGAIAFGSALAALFFVRYYRDTRDELFLFFAAAFVLEALNRVVLTFDASPNEASPRYYLLRAFGYGLILLGIYRKNRR